ncbi:MAG: hypothetical protein HY901_26200 [Deltaproteobacteria bacterium]|nr:hypothetical protein [Deltaproteobacteria bacterium]
MKTKLLAVVLLVVGWGCSGAYDSPEMKVRYQPPHGTRLLEEQPGPPRVARFSSGLEIRSVNAQPPAIEEGKLEALLAQVSPGIKGDIINARMGTLDAGRVVRWSIKEAEGRTLIYYLPRTDRYLVLSLSAPDSRFATLESQFELSLATLKIRD